EPAISLDTIKRLTGETWSLCRWPNREATRPLSATADLDCSKPRNVDVRQHIPGPVPTGGRKLLDNSDLDVRALLGYAAQRNGLRSEYQYRLGSQRCRERKQGTVGGVEKEGERRISVEPLEGPSAHGLRVLIEFDIP